MATALGLKDFLNHDTRGGGDAQFLKNWKKRPNKTLDLWLHTQAPIYSVYRHPWPRVREIERDGRKSLEVWSGKFNSLEAEETLNNQYKRDPNGARIFTPEACPMSLMLEAVYQAWLADEVAWTEPLFRFEGDDPNKNKTLHVAPMIGVLDKVWDDLDDDERAAALALGVPSPKDAWMQKMTAKCHYIFAIVDNDDTGNGIQITTETTLVGEKTRKVVNDAIVSDGEIKGDPTVTPYAIRWVHKPSEKAFGDKYDAIALRAVELRPEVRKLIVETDAPDLDHLVQPGDIQELRASMEAHYIGPEGLLDFDAIFSVAESRYGIEAEPKSERVPPVGADTQPDAVSEPADADDVDEPEMSIEAQAAAAKAAGVAGPLSGPARYEVEGTKGEGDDTRYFAADSCELFACDECEEIVRDDETKCVHCGHQYGEPEPVAPVQPKPAPKPRAKKRATKKAAAKTKAQASGADKLDF